MLTLRLNQLSEPWPSEPGQRSSQPRTGPHWLQGAGTNGPCCALASEKIEQQDPCPKKGDGKVGPILHSKNFRNIFDQASLGKSL